jgi:1-acyl-sn-glycerol-3-phosphate acyltransferase
MENIVKGKNITIMCFWVLYIILLIKLISKLQIPLTYKLSLLFIIILVFKRIRIIVFTFVSYLLLICRIRITRDLFSAYVFNKSYKAKLTLEDMNSKGPYIYVSNYPFPFLNYFSNYIFPKNTIYVGRNSILYGVHLLSNNFHGIKNGNNFKEIEKFTTESYKNNNNILVFCEEIHKNKPSLYKVGRIKTGVFSIAKKLNIQVLPVFIGPLEDTLGVLHHQNSYIHIDKPFLVKNITEARNKVSKIFSKQYFKCLKDNISIN